MSSQVSFIIDWSVWIPIGIAVASLALTLYQMSKKNASDDMDSVE